MASLWRRERSKYWTACFTTADGRRLKRSTRETDRRKAQKVADAYEHAAQVAASARQTRKVISELHLALTAQDLPQTTMREFVDRWISRKAPSVSVATLSSYKTASSRWIEHLGDQADGDIALISRGDVTAYRDAQAEVVSPRTVNHRMRCLRMIFRDAIRDGLCAEDPTEFVESVRTGNAQERRPFTLAELRKVMEIADDEWQSLILLGLYTGQRLGDLARLTWEDLDLVGRVLRIRTVKTGRLQRISVAPPLLRHLAAREKIIGEATGLMHPELGGTVLAQEGRVSTLSREFGDLLADAGLREQRDHQGRGSGRRGKRERYDLSFHSLRRTATSMLHEAGVPFAVAQEFIGHDSKDVHDSYVSIGEEALRSAADLLPEWDAIEEGEE